MLVGWARQRLQTAGRGYRAGPAANTPPLDPETLQRLKALGYVDRDEE